MITDNLKKNHGYRISRQSNIKVPVNLSQFTTHHIKARLF